MASSKMSIKLLIDSKSKKVLFAEASKDFVDFLFNLMSLPVGTVVCLLKKRGMVGCLGKLYKSIKKLDESYIQPKQKDFLLNPSPSVPAAKFPLLLGDGQSTGLKMYGSTSTHCSCVTDVSGASCTCGNGGGSLTKQLRFVSGKSDATGFVAGVVTYMVMNDLSVQPMSSISIITLLNKFGVKEIGSLQEKVVTVGLNEALKLLKASLSSKTVLTDVFAES